MKRLSVHLVWLIVFVMVLGIPTLWAGGEKEAEGAEAEYRIRIGHANIAADDSALHVTATAFKDLVEEYSDGRISAQIFPNGQLGNDQEMADMVVSGALEVQVTSVNLITQYAPRMRALILPYMFQESEDFRRAREALWDDVNDYLVERANMRLITLWDSGFRHVMSTEPVRTLDDLRDLKFRVPPSPIMQGMVESWGVSPTPVEWSEVFNALQLGTIDAIEVDDSVLISARMNEVVDYITNDDHIMQVSIAAMSQSFYEQLPSDLQDAVDRAAWDSNARVDARSGEILEKARRVSREEEGVEFLGRPDDYDQWVRRARSIWPDFYDDIGDGDAQAGKAVVQQIFDAAGMEGELPE